MLSPLPPAFRPFESICLSTSITMATLRKRIRSEANYSPSPPSVIVGIADDLLIEILIRLPNPRSASRCKAVCKRWSSLISDHRFNCRFVSHHQALNKPQALLLHTDDANDLSFIPPMPDRVRECFKVLDCFKDLVLCGFPDVLVDPCEIGRTYVVCNPFTKQWMALPLAPAKVLGCAIPVTRLVCEPLSTSKCNYKLDSGDDDQVFAYSECRFRVVSIYRHETSIKLDVFCSESGNWRKEAVVYDGYPRVGSRNVCACNGKLFWLCVDDEFGSEQLSPHLAVFDPFRFHMHTTRHEVLEYHEDLKMDISVSQGALHMIELEIKPTHARLRVRRLDDDHESWRDLCEGLLVRPSEGNYEIEHCKILDLHPEKPEVVFFQYLSPSASKDAILCCDLRKGELEFFTDLRQLIPRWTVFQPRTYCWPTPIPRYEELRGKYDGSCSWLKAAKDNNSLNSGSENKAAAPPRTVAPTGVLCDATETLMRDVAEKIGMRRHPLKMIAYCDEMQKLMKEMSELDRQREEILSPEVGQVDVWKIRA